MATTILLRRGLVASLPTLATGEIGYATDTKTLYVGDSTASPPRILMAGTGIITNSDVNASAAIAYSKLALTGSILNADINASAAIAYSKLSLTGSILNADINASAAIARSKIAAGTASHVVIHDGSGFLSSEASLAVTRGGTGAASLTSNNVILGNGTSAVQFVAPSTSGNVLTSNGTTWTSAAPAGGATCKVISTTETRNSSTMVASSVLTFGLTWAASTAYSVYGVLLIINTGSANPDADFQFNGPSTAASSLNLSYTVLRDGATNVVAMGTITSFVTGGTAGELANLSLNTIHKVIITGGFVTSGTPGSTALTLEWAQNLTDAGNVTSLLPGSFIKVQAHA